MWDVATNGYRLDDATQDEATQDEATQDEATQDEATQDEATQATHLWIAGVQSGLMKRPRV